MILKEIIICYPIIGLKIDIKIIFELKALKKKEIQEGHSDPLPFLSKIMRLNLHMEDVFPVPERK